MPSITTTESVPSRAANDASNTMSIVNDVKKGEAPNGSGSDNDLSPLENLTKQISRSSKAITDFLKSENYPQPSFERAAPATALPFAAPEHIKAARVELMEASLKAFQLAVGPQEYLPNLAANLQYVACFRWLTKFDIFSLVPVDAAMSYPELASKARVSPKQLKTVARMAMTSSLFCEPTPGFIAHTATSAQIATNSGLHDWASFLSDVTAPTAFKHAEASLKWPESVDKTETAYNVAFDTELPFFDHLQKLPNKTKQFAGYMKHVQNSEGTALKHLIAGYDWARLGKATVVDVGGSTGAGSTALAQAFPSLNFIVQDLEENAADGRAATASLPIQIRSRIHFQGHDFFSEQPFKGAQAYLLRMILHDWPATEATTILKNLVPALNAGSRILIMDTVLPRPGSMPSAQERLLRVRDMTMLQAFNSLERDLEDWNDILTAVDPRMEIVNVVQPTGSVMSIIEVRLNG